MDKFYPGEITRRHTDGTYDIKFDDGERKSGVKKHQIRLSKKSSSKNSPRRRRKMDRSDDDNISDDGEDDFDRGDKVEAKVKGWTKFYPGEITRRHTDGTYD